MIDGEGMARREVRGARPAVRLASQHKSGEGRLPCVNEPRDSFPSTVHSGVRVLDPAAVAASRGK